MLVLWLAVMLGCGKVTAYEDCERTLEVSCGCDLTEECDAETVCSNADDKEGISDEDVAFSECYDEELEKSCDGREATTTCCDTVGHSNLCG